MAKDLALCALLDVYGAFLSEKQREIMSHYFNDDLSLSEIAENEGITRQAVSEIIRRGEAALKEYEEKCGYHKKISTLQKICSSDISDKDKISGVIKIVEDF